MAQPATPNLLLLGAPKCGTSSIASALNSSAAVSFGESKEAGILSNGVFSTADLVRLYERHYSSVPHGVRYLLDATPWLMYRPDVLQVASRLRPNDEVLSLVSLRRPVDRIRSMYLDQVARGTERRPLEVALRTEIAHVVSSDLELKQRYVWTSMYGAHLRRLVEASQPCANLKAVFFESAVASEPAVLRSWLATWLDVDVGHLDHENQHDGVGSMAAPFVDALVRTMQHVPPRIRVRLRTAGRRVSGAAMKHAPRRPRAIPELAVRDSDVLARLDDLLQRDRVVLEHLLPGSIECPLGVASWVREPDHVRMEDFNHGAGSGGPFQ